MCSVTYVAAEIQCESIDFSREMLIYITGGSGLKPCVVFCSCRKQDRWSLLLPVYSLFFFFPKIRLLRDANSLGASASVQAIAYVKVTICFHCSILTHENLFVFFSFFLFFFKIFFSLFFLFFNFFSFWKKLHVINIIPGNKGTRGTAVSPLSPQ